MQNLCEHTVDPVTVTPSPATMFRETDLFCVLHAPSSPSPYTCGTEAESSGAHSCTPAVWKILEVREQLLHGDGISHRGDPVLQSNSVWLCRATLFVLLYFRCGKPFRFTCEIAYIHHTYNDVLICSELWVIS